MIVVFKEHIIKSDDFQKICEIGKENKCAYKILNHQTGNDQFWSPK